jgi:H+-translocating NAD(P) transhydrogenase subunit alpha
MSIIFAVARETADLEHRVALVPEVVTRLSRAGHEVRVEAGAGKAARYPDAEFEKAGARLVADRPSLLRGASVLLGLQPPAPDLVSGLARGSIVIAPMSASRQLDAVVRLRDAGLTSFALELLPRITRAQGMDVLSSQASVAGYRATLIGAELAPKFFPMLTTAAGTIRPARVLILGAGVAGLMAIATAKRLGAIVEAYDVRRAAGEQVRSLGAKFLQLEINAEGSGGYARELTDAEKAQEAEMLARAVGEADVVITTAAIPGRKAPILVRKPMVERMHDGAVVVDLAAETGGNCELTAPGQTIESGGVTIAGPLNLASQLPYHASQMFARNVEAFVKLLVDPTGGLVSDYSDEILAATLLTRGGEVVHKPTAELLAARRT